MNDTITAPEAEPTREDIEYEALCDQIDTLTAERDRYRAAIEKAISWNTHDVHEPKFWDLHRILTRALNEGATDA